MRTCFRSRQSQLAKMEIRSLGLRALKSGQRAAQTYSYKEHLTKAP